MLKTVLLALIGLPLLNYAQVTDVKPIQTAAPFLRYGYDGRSGGMGDMGAATTADVFSQRWNASKYLFSTSSGGFGVSYSPYLASIANDIFTGGLNYFTKFNEKSALGASLTYFNIGQVELTGVNGDLRGYVYPNELAVDISYGLMLSDRYGMAVAMRYIRSDPNDKSNTSTYKVGNSFAIDISGTFQSEEHSFANIEGQFRTGFNISNVGPKINYSNSSTAQASYLPTNLALGFGYDFIFDYDNRVSLSTQFNKLLVPTTIYDENGVSQPDKGVLAGMISSFGDAPGGFSEELQEIYWSLGAEYRYSDVFGLRTGYYHESKEKGLRRFISFGTSVRWEGIGIDFAYAFSLSKINSAGADNGFKVSLLYDFGNY